MMYLVMYDAKGNCLKVIESKSQAFLQTYALNSVRGRKKACLCNSEGRCIWMARGMGKDAGVKILTKGEYPLGEVISGIVKS